jgi:hypothetical protein
VAGNVEQAEQAGQGWLIISRDDCIEDGWWPKALARIAGSANLPRGNLRIPYRTVRQGQPPASYDFIWQPRQAR